MKIAISATNPCHLFDLAKALHARQALSRYYSGYPRWRLHPPAGFPLHAHSARTLATYGLLRLPRFVQPAPHRLFRWQDAGFDRAVARDLDGDAPCMLHALPGQAHDTFAAARGRGITTVLNHASGPVRQQIALLAEEYQKAGLAAADFHAFDADYFRREDAEYSLADWHCVASSIVRRQLVVAGVPPDRIWVVPYAADREVFHPPSPSESRDSLRIVFAGQVTIRKGLRVLLAAAEKLRASRPVFLDLYGPISADMRGLLAAVENRPWIAVRGPVSQPRLAAAFRTAAVLVLPSWEEGFGLVVPQALSCGTPCVVSDRVGASDVIIHHHNGSVFSAGDPDALANELSWWLDHAGASIAPPPTWDFVAGTLLDLTSTALTNHPRAL